MMGGSSERLTWQRNGLSSELAMKTSTVFAAALLPALACSLAMAKPAPWFKWRSKLDGTLACSQTPLGQGWEQASGPYQDSRCAKLIVVK
jgi:hypothetical protein